MLGFPIEMIALVRCTYDGSTVLLDSDHVALANATHVSCGRLRCTQCHTCFHIEQGILNLLDQSMMDAESVQEQKSRNADGFTVNKLSSPLMKAENDMEMLSTLEALPVDASHTVLELGCGEGRYTLPLAAKAKRLIAVDFSIELLRNLQAHLPANTQVALVLGDISSLKLAPSAFDFAVSTLTSNLPTPKHRKSLYALANHTLRETGRFVFSAHHHSVRQIFTRQKKSGHYRVGGIYRYNFNLRECREEVLPYFEDVAVRPIQIHMPFARTLRLPIVSMSRLLECVPILNRFGMLVLCVAKQPRKLAGLARLAP